MKKILLATVLFIAPVTSANAWWDAYGGFTCGYMDPLTSFLDGIFGPPCPPPMPVRVAPAPVPVARPVPVPAPVPVAAPMPMAAPMPVPMPVPGLFIDPYLVNVCARNPGGCL